MKYIVFADDSGVEVKRGVCQDAPQALRMQAAAGQTAYSLSEKDEVKGTSLIRLKGGAIVAA